MGRIDLPPRKTYNKPTNCRICDVELTKENRYRYLGYTKTICKECKSIKANKYNRKKAEALKMYKRF